MPGEDGRLYLSSEATEMGNEEYITQFLDRLLDVYSYERLSDLSRRRLEREVNRVELDFMRLRARFNQGELVQKDEHLARVAHGDNYRDLGELTTEQAFEIGWAKQMIERNFNRALVDARERRTNELGRVLGPITSLFPIFGGGVTVNIDVGFEGKAR